METTCNNITLFINNVDKSEDYVKNELWVETEDNVSECYIIECAWV